MNTKKVIGGAILAILIKFAADFPGMLLCMGLLQIKVIPEPISIALYGITYLALTILFVKLVFGKWFKLSKEDLFMPKFSLKIPYVILAVILPLAVCGMYFLFAKGHMVFNDMGQTKNIGVVTEGFFAISVGSGFVEEILFRGVLMNLLKKRWNTMVAVIAPSVLFGLVHLMELEDCPFLDGLQLMIAGTMTGIMFSLIALKTKSVWNSAIVHCIWNLIMCGGILTISNQPSDCFLMTYVLDSKSIALTGGEFGSEASVFAIFAYCVVAAVLLFALKKQDQAKTETVKSAVPEFENI